MNFFALSLASPSRRVATGALVLRPSRWLLLALVATASTGGCRDRSADDALAQQPSGPVTELRTTEDRAEPPRSPTAREESAAEAARAEPRERSTDDGLIASRPALAPATLPQEQRASGYYAPQPGEPLASVEANRRRGGPMALLGDDAGEEPTPRSGRAGFDDDDFGPADQRALEERIRQELRQARSAGLSDADLAALSIAVDQGSVTLSGTVESDEVVRAVEEQVSRVPGVGNVHNRLEARNGPRTAE